MGLGLIDAGEINIGRGCWEHVDGHGWVLQWETLWSIRVAKLLMRNVVDANAPIHYLKGTNAFANRVRPSYNMFMFTFHYPIVLACGWTSVSVMKYHD